MTDRPIIFSGPMVRALLDGRKTQTRRILKPRGPFLGALERHGKPKWWFGATPDEITSTEITARFQKGDRLWVRENWCHFPADAPDDMGEAVYYQAEHTGLNPTRSKMVVEVMRRNGVKWRPSIHMPRKYSRLTLLVTDVRIQHLQDISNKDAIAEGIVEDDGDVPGIWYCPGGYEYGVKRHGAWPVEAFRYLWEAINGPGSWAADPWVAAVTFTVHHRNIDAIAEVAA